MTAPCSTLAAGNREQRGKQEVILAPEIDGVDVNTCVRLICHDVDRLDSRTAWSPISHARDYTNVDTDKPSRRVQMQTNLKHSIGRQPFPSV